MNNAGEQKCCTSIHSPRKKEDTKEQGSYIASFVIENYHMIRDSKQKRFKL